MASVKRLIDANEFCKDCLARNTYNCTVCNVGTAPTVDAVPVDDIKIIHMLIDKNGIPEVKLRFGERVVILRRENDPVDAVEVVHGRWLYDSGSGNHFCSACDEYAIERLCRDSDGAEYYEAFLTNYCHNCGAKMDGDENA